MNEAPSSWRLFWESVLRFQKGKVAPWIGLRNSVGVVLPLAAGLALHHITSGILAATGALNVAFSDNPVAYPQRLRRMLATSVLVGCGVFTGELCGWSRGLIMSVSMVWAFAAGMLVAVDTVAADVGTISLVTLVVYSAFPASPATAISSGALALCGGLLQTALSVALWPLRRYAHQRRMLGTFFRALAKSASGLIHAAEAPPTSAQSTDAQESLGALDGIRSLEAERYRALLSQAERIRLGLLVLTRLRTRIMREEAAPEVVARLDRLFGIAAVVLETIANGLSGDETSAHATALLAEAAAIAEGLRAAPGATVQDARRQIDALIGQFRAALDLTEHALPKGAAQFEQRESAKGWQLRLRSTFAILRANLSLRSTACRHAIRLSICVAVAEMLGQSLGVMRGYWAPMTVAIVLKPDFASTFSRGVQRFAGTFAGLVLATALFHLLPVGSGLEIALIGAFTFVARGLGPANYGIAATAITALVVLLLALNGTAPNVVMVARGINTAIGGLVALAAYSIWPTWERTQLGQTMAQLLEAYAAYFQTIRRAYERPGEPLPRELDSLRLDGRRARSNLEASVDRLGAEPGMHVERKQILGSLLANSHRLAHALMSLEGGLSTRRSAPPRAAFSAFADAVEFTIATLAGILRGAPAGHARLPDLREAHHALVGEGGAATAKYALINVETDRIVNSLNTLSEDVFRWVKEA